TLQLSCRRLVAACNLAFLSPLGLFSLQLLVGGEGKGRRADGVELLLQAAHLPVEPGVVETCLHSLEHSDDPREDESGEGGAEQKGADRNVVILALRIVPPQP